MAYRIAAVDVHKKMVAVVVADVEVEGEYQFERRKFGATPDQLHLLAQWLVQQEAEEVVMESTAQYWKPVWGTLEQYWSPARQQRDGAMKMCGTLHLCQAKSNRGPRGRKNDFADGERMVKRLVAQELVLSFVPDPEQRIWRAVTRRKYQLIGHQRSGMPTLSWTRLTMVLRLWSTRCASRTSWRVCWNRHTSSCRALCRICWASVRGAC